MNFVDLKERVAIRADVFTPQERDFILDAINAAIPPENAELHNPGNYMGRIEAIWAYLSLDDGGEGVCAAPMGGTFLPMTAASNSSDLCVAGNASSLAATMERQILEIFPT